MMKPINPNSGFQKRSVSPFKKQGFGLLQGLFSSSHNKKTFIKRGIGSFVIFLIIVVVWAQSTIYRNLPDVSTIKDMVFSQATVITDRNGKELYKLFEQNRQYVAYEDISETMIHAIVAMEDQRYWDHSGLDAMGILRAAIKNVTNPGSLQGASTIPQQLVMNLLLYRGRTFSEKVSRKLREMVLTKRLDKTLESQIRKENKGLNNEELRRKMKETTLELYLNYIFLGNNAYGIEVAAQTYFGTSANNLGVLESAIIASIPKGPSIYEPYRNKSRLMGEVRISDTQGNIVEASPELYEAVYNQIALSLSQTRISAKTSSTDLLKLLGNKASFRIPFAGRTFVVEYIHGRKDLALTRMFEDGYIDDGQIKDAFVRGLNYSFQSNTFPIHAPHFVHWITELLEKDYDKALIQEGGLVVTTSLDREIQEQIETIFKQTQGDLASYGANNKAMIYMDSSNGDVLAYIGSTDYFDETIEGKNDIIRRKRQIGSSIKPLIYALGFQELALTLDTPIFDIPSNVGGDEPNNADGEFLGLLPLRQALAFSRNIPAIKMFLALGGEAIAKPWLQKMGFASLLNTVEYGYPLALGAGEVTMLELATAYTQLSRQGEKVTINPILEIRSSDGSILYEKEVQKEPGVLKPGAASLIRDILSNTANMPSNRVSMFSVRNLRLAAKSGTSDVKTNNGTRPRDGWLATYTPSRVALFWVGNTNGAPMNRNAFGGTILGANMRSFYTWLVNNNLIANESMTSIDTIETQVSKLTGLPISDATPSAFVVTTKGTTYKQAGSYDMGATVFDFDTMCNGLASPYTPMEDLQQGYIIQPYTFMPNRFDLEEIKLRWSRSTQKDTGWIQELPASQRERILGTKYNFTNIFIITPQDTCPDRIPKEDQRINIEILMPVAAGNIARTSSVTYSINSPKMIREVTVFVNDEIVGRTRYNPAKNNIVDATIVTIPTHIPAGDIVLKVVAADISGFSNVASQVMKLIGQDTTPPRIESRRTIKNNDGTYEIRLFIVDDESYVTTGTLKKNGTVVHTIQGSVVSYQTSELGEYEVVAKDFYGNTLQQTITITP